VSPHDEIPPDLARLLLDGARDPTVIASAPMRLRKPRMVTPRSPATFTDEYGTHALQPGRDRLALSHPWVSKRPELFRAADGTDRQTARELTRMQRSRHVHTRRRQTRLPRTSGSLHALPAVPRRPYAGRLAPSYGLGPRRPTGRWSL
jgi:hypothetical protein